MTTTATGKRNKLKKRYKKKTAAATTRETRNTKPPVEYVEKSKLEPDVQIQQLQAFLGIKDIVSELAGAEMKNDTEVKEPHLPPPGQRIVVYTDYHYVVRDSNGRETDSYKKGYQLGYSQGLCMVFAAMIFRRQTQQLEETGGDFHERDFPGLIKNTKTALLWAHDRLENMSQKDVFTFGAYGRKKKFKMTVEHARQQMKMMAHKEPFAKNIALQLFFDPNLDPSPPTTEA